MQLTPAPRPELVPSAAAGEAGDRLVFLDALRGFDMIWILGAAGLTRALCELWDNPFTRGIADQFEHAQWVGLHFYDLIYPLFLFLIGISIILSIDKTIAREGRRAAVGRIFRRGAMLYLFNFIYNGGFSKPWPQMRVVSGVLAMIAFSYVIAALVYCYWGRSTRVLAGTTLGLLLVNWALLGLVPFPDFRLDDKTIAPLAAKAGSREPAAIAALVPARVHGTYDEAHNLSNYLDFRFIPGQMPNKYYENQGLLSPLSAVTLCFAGIFAGRLLQSGQLTPRRKALILALAGCAAIGTGALWALELPVVKKLWTASFCLVSGGISALFVATFYLVIDVWNHRRWCRPFVWIGVNPITLYMLVALVSFRRIAERLAGGDVQAWLDRLAKGLGNVALDAVALALVLLLARFLYQRRIFLRV